MHHIQTQQHSEQEAKGSIRGGSPPPLPFTQEETLLPAALLKTSLTSHGQKVLTHLPLSPGARPIFPEFE